MMLHNLLNEIVRRRLWPVLALAVLAAVAAPVFFMKSAPADAPAVASASPAPATAGKLPARAQRLLDATAAAGSRRAAKGSERDPFAAPASHRATTPTATGAAPSTAVKQATVTGTVRGVTGTTATPATPATTPATTPSTTPSTTPVSGPASVDVRFGASANGRLHRAVPRLQPYFIHGKVAAVFVKYSPSLNKAVFAVAPGLIITGPVKCREVKGVCRYLDIPAGSFARLTMITTDRIVVRRRLDVTRIHHGVVTGTTAVAAADRSENACLLNLLRTVKQGAAPIDRAACER
jgi:hypothetical protein